MLIRRLQDCTEITAADDSRLRELLHPDRDYGFTARYSLAHAIVAPGQATQPHRLTSSEVYYIMSGNGEMHVDDEQTNVSSGDALEIPPGAVQFIKNTGSDYLVFLCIVDPAWQPDQEEVL